MYLNIYIKIISLYFNVFCVNVYDVVKCNLMKIVTFKRERKNLRNKFKLMTLTILKCEFLLVDFK